LSGAEYLLLHTFITEVCTLQSC